MIQESYCSYEVAKLLKEKGFPFMAVIGSMWVDKDGIENYQTMLTNITWDNGDKTPVATHAFAMKWLREVHNIHIMISFGSDIDRTPRNFYYPNVAKFTQRGDTSYIDFTEVDGYDTNEQAVEAALKYSLENLI